VCRVLCWGSEGSATRFGSRIRRRVVLRRRRDGSDESIAPTVRRSRRRDVCVCTEYEQHLAVDGRERGEKSSFKHTKRCKISAHIHILTTVFLSLSLRLDPNYQFATDANISWMKSMVSTLTAIILAG
jgi:hypothetical protein